MIASKEQLEQAALQYGLLPFFSNAIPGFSVEEMAAPGMLFGETTADYGCWEWKGPVIREQTTAYGKFFRKKAGFVARELYPDFLNFRRGCYPLVPASQELELLEIIRQREVATASELRNEIFGPTARNRRPQTLFDVMQREKTPHRQILEGPLQRLQMGGRVLIADFEYKHTAQGDRYGWGVALYTTPEIWFGNDIAVVDRTPEESFERLVCHLEDRLPGISRKVIERLLR